jgi:hypothetical protein
MADTISNSPGQYYSQNAVLNACRITLANGQQFDVKDNIIELSYYEDFYSFCISGYLMLRDGLGLLDIFKIMGGEKLELNFDSFYDPNSTTLKDFVIYKVGDRKPTGNMNSEFYKIYFCSKDLLVNEQMRISKSYKGKKISDVVSDAVTTYLGTNRTFTPSPTTGFYDFVIPMMKPFETISWLSNFARPQNSGKSGTIGADMFFYEDKDGYRFESIDSLMNTAPVWKYRYQQNNLDSEVSNLNLEDNSVIALEFVHSFNILKDISSGAFSNKVISINALTKQTEVQVFDYTKYVNQLKPSNGQGVMPNIQTSTGLTPNQTPDGKLRVVASNFNSKNSPYIKNIDNGEGLSQDYFVQQTLSLRLAQTALANHTKLKIVVPGNTRLTVGNLVSFNYFKILLGTGDNNRELDNTYSGTYLITAVRHILQSSGVFQTVLEIVKSSTIPTST